MTASILPSNNAAARVIASGGVIAFRTDTFYGLGVDPLNAAAVKRLWELKGREEGKPILLLISDREQVERFVSTTSSRFMQLAKQFWPGPLTIIGTARSQLPLELTAGTGTIGLRLPDDERVRGLVRACGGALTATSANPARQPAARSAKQVGDYFADKLDLIVDDGAVEVSEPSTVVDATGKTAKIVREGLITRAQLAQWVTSS